MASIVGRNIRGIRTDLGYSQAKLAGLARTSQLCIRRIETGNNHPRARMHGKHRTRVAGCGGRPAARDISRGSPEMSRCARDWARRCRGLTPALRCILLALAEHADEEGRCWPSLTRLAELTEVDRRTVTRGLAELEDRSLMVRERHRQQSTTYTLAIGASDGDARPRREGRDTPPDATGPEARDPEGRGMTPLHQGHETARDLTPLGARDSHSRGETPLGRGGTPPDLGVSDPPNRHKNRHRTESEPSVCGDDTAHPEKPTANDSRKATPIPRDWRPGERVFAWAATRGMTRTRKASQGAGNDCVQCNSRRPVTRAAYRP